MILIVSLFLGATVLVITAVAGFLTIVQLRQAGGIEHSARAVFAADAGAEWGLCAVIEPAAGGACRFEQGFMRPNPDTQACPPDSPTFQNGATVGVLLECVANVPRRIISQGGMGNAVRIIEIKLGGP